MCEIELRLWRLIEDEALDCIVCDDIKKKRKKHFPRRERALYR